MLLFVALKHCYLDREVVPLERCRLVKFDHINDVLDRSFDLDTDDGSRSLSQLLGMLIM